MTDDHEAEIAEALALVRKLRNRGRKKPLSSKEWLELTKAKSILADEYVRLLDETENADYEEARAEAEFRSTRSDPDGI